MSSSDVAHDELAVLFQLGTVGDVDDHRLLERFLSRPGPESEAAFAVLVERHGPMVLRLCRRWLGDPHDAQDAFQATFLVLVKRARSIRDRNSVASWLFGVACRVASRAKRDRVRRAAKERRSAEQVAPRQPAGSVPESWEELYEEIDRLPEKYRLPIVLHYLEALTYEQVARKINCPLRTVQTRLARGRDRLRARLARRGQVISEGLLVAFPTQHLISSEVSRLVAGKLARDATRLAAGAASHLASANVASWTYGVLWTMTMKKLVSTSILTLAIAGIGVGTAVLAQQGKAGQPASEPLSPEAKRSPPARVERIVRSMEHENQAIQEKLEQTISVNFDQAPLEDILKFIKVTSSGPTDDGIPFHVEKAGLKEVGLDMTTRVSVIANKLQTKQVLQQVLSPLGLSYTVSRGALLIDSRLAIAQLQVEDRLNTLESKLDRILDALERGKRTRGR